MTPDEIQIAWNQMVDGMDKPKLPRIRKMTRCRVRLVQYASNDIDDWPDFIAAVGRTGKWLRSQRWADFEWCLHADNIARLWEGFYEDKEPNETEDKRPSCVPR